MDVTEGTEDIPQLEERIKQVIVSIRNNHSRPSFHNILTSLKKGNYELEMDKLKMILDNMVSNKIIYDGGKEGLESFFISKIRNEKIVMDNLERDGTDDLDTADMLESFIHDKFYEVLINRIKTEVKHEIEITLDKCNLLSAKSDKSNCFNVDESLSLNKKDNNELIESLKSEIAFLRNEIASKDKIIEMVIKDKSSINNVHNGKNVNDRINDDSFIYPKKNSKTIYNDNSNYDINSINRFSVLGCDEHRAVDKNDDLKINESRVNNSHFKKAKN